MPGGDGVNCVSELNLKFDERGRAELNLGLSVEKGDREISRRGCTKLGGSASQVCARRRWSELRVRGELAA